MKVEVTKKIPSISKNVDWVQHHGALRQMRIKLKGQNLVAEFDDVSREEFDAFLARDVLDYQHPFGPPNPTRGGRKVSDFDDPEWMPRFLDDYPPETPFES